MNINYIFLFKKRKDEILNKSNIHIEILNDLFFNVTETVFEVDYKGKRYSLNYFVYYDDKVDMFKLSISLDETPAKSAEVLSCVDELIRTVKSRKYYNIIVAYDGVSSYYCNRAYPLFNEFERKLRELVYIINAKTFGVEWYKKTVSEDLKNKLKETSKGKSDSTLIESGLYEMTMFDLESYLFMPYSDKDFDDMIIDGELTEHLLNDKSREEIIDFLSLCIPKSLWDRFFEKNVKITDLQIELSKTRDYRNKVAHSKNFYLKNYNECKKVIKKIFIQIELAIDDINSKEVSKQRRKDTQSAINTYKSAALEALRTIEQSGFQSASKAYKSAVLEAQRSMMQPEFQGASKALKSAVLEAQRSMMQPEFQGASKALKSAVLEAQRSIEQLRIQNEMKLQNNKVLLIQQNKS